MQEPGNIPMVNWWFMICMEDLYGRIYSLQDLLM